MRHCYGRLEFNMKHCMNMAVARMALEGTPIWEQPALNRQLLVLHSQNKPRISGML